MVQPAAPSRALLEALAARPTDLALRTRAARALEAEERHAEALDLLLKALINLTAHEERDLVPCLCSRCLPAAPLEAEADGLLLRRDYAIAEGRILFFWSPAELDEERKSLRHSVAAALQERIRHLRSAEWRRREQRGEEPRKRPPAARKSRP